MGVQDRDYIREKHRKMRDAGTWGEGLHGSRQPKRRSRWPYGHLSDADLADRVTLKNKSRQTRAPGDGIYQPAPWRRKRMPWWAMVLLAPFVSFGSLAGIGILVWSISVVFRLTA